MGRRGLRAGAALLTMVAFGCGQADERTDDTSRALLTGATEGGPSSPAGDDLGLASRAGRAFLPELGYNLGSESAPVKIIEFADFGCGYCRLFHQESLPTILAEFVDTDQVEWKLLPFVSGQFENSLAITEATECTLEQDRDAYQAMAVRVWEGQPEWKPSEEPAALARGWVSELGIDMEEYDACVASDRRIERIAGATAVARQLGIQGTPTFWIVGYGPLQGALPLQVFRNVLTAVVEEVEAAADSAAAASPN